MGDRRKRNKEKDPTWDHCLRINDDKTSRPKLKCNYCLNEYWGGVIRMKNHLAHTHKDVKPCLKVPEDVKNYFAKLLENIKKKIEQFDDEFDVECLQEDELQKIGDDNTKKGTMDEYLKGKSNPKQVTLPSLVKDRTATCLAICRFFYAHAIRFYLVKSPLFKKNDRFNC